MKEKISRNKISRHYKSFFELENMALAEDDHLMIDWGESLIEHFVNQEVEKRIAKRMPSEEEILNEFPFMDEDIDFVSNIDAQMGARWVVSRLTNPGDSQKTEGGEG